MVAGWHFLSEGLDRLGAFLESCKGGGAMNLEELDGFFAALIAAPEVVMPSEYYPEVFGGEMADACEFGSLDEANEILGLMMRHWNDIAGTLRDGAARKRLGVMLLPLRHQRSQREPLLHIHPYPKMESNLPQRRFCCLVKIAHSRIITTLCPRGRCSEIGPLAPQT